MKKKAPRKHSYPPEVVLIAHCIHPVYREDYKRYEDSSMKKNDQLLAELEQRYPRLTGHRFPNPDMLDWVRLARAEGVLIPMDQHVLESPSSTLPGEEPVRIVPAWFPVARAGMTPEQGYKKYSLETLHEERWLHVEIDTHAPIDTILERIKLDLDIFKQNLRAKEKESRNRKQALIKNLTLFHTSNLAKTQKVDPHILLDPKKFPQKPPSPGAEWNTQTKAFSRAKRRAMEIFTDLGMPVVP